MKIAWKKRILQQGVAKKLYRFFLFRPKSERARESCWENQFHPHQITVFPVSHCQIFGIFYWFHYKHQKLAFKFEIIINFKYYQTLWMYKRNCNCIGVFLNACQTAVEFFGCFYSFLYFNLLTSFSGSRWFLQNLYCVHLCVCVWDNCSICITFVCCL